LTLKAPSTLIVCPEMKEAAGMHKKATVVADSLADGRRPPRPRESGVMALTLIGSTSNITQTQQPNNDRVCMYQLLVSGYTREVSNSTSCFYSILLFVFNGENESFGISRYPKFLSLQEPVMHGRRHLRVFGLARNFDFALVVAAIASALPVLS